MAQQPDNLCKGCDHYVDTGLFEECGHASSKYRFDDRDHWHTVTHMRTRGACGERAVNYSATVKA